MRAVIIGSLIAHTWMGVVAIIVLGCVLSGCAAIQDAAAVGYCAINQGNINHKCN